MRLLNSIAAFCLALVHKRGNTFKESYRYWKDLV